MIQIFAKQMLVERAFVTFGRLACSLGVVLAFASTSTYAELKPIADEELSQYSGQAAIAFDVTELADVSYTRVTLGLEADVQINADQIELGNYARAGETLAADIDVANLGFGSISTDASQVQLDGQTYAVNDIVPFEFNDPFFEIAQDDTGELTGFRIGFGEARGQLSGDFNSISGNVGADVTDFFGDTYRTSTLNEAGQVDQTRAQYFGVDNTTTGGATNCTTGSYCFALSDYQTLDVGQRDATTGAVDYTNDFFISFQKEATTWATSDGGSIEAALGAFINIPTALGIDLNTGVNANGIDKVRTEFIERGVGRF